MIPGVEKTTHAGRFSGEVGLPPSADAALHAQSSKSDFRSPAVQGNRRCSKSTDTALPVPGFAQANTRPDHAPKI
jgi:hypothetical protein